MKEEAWFESLEEISDDISDVKAIDLPALITFLALFAIVALQFFTRYVLNDSLGWTEEIARYFLILLGFSGAITCARKNSHIHLEFLYHYMPLHWIKPLTLITLLIAAGFWGYLSWLGVELAGNTRSNMVSIAMPKSYLYYAVAVGCAIVAIYAFGNFIRASKKPSEEVAREKLGL